MAGGSGEGAADLIRVENDAGQGAFVVLCDHASNALPRWASPLGLGEAQMTRHIAWDPGALGVARGLSRGLDAPLLYPDVSRLVIDCNRSPDAPDSIAVRSEDTDIPGNRKLPGGERERRVKRVYEPYHAAIDSLLDRREKRPVLLALHSFTPTYLGRARPWQVGILFDDDDRLGRALIGLLRREPDLEVGENEPYSPADGVYHTLQRHARPRGLPAVMIEIRNDQIASPEAQDRWASLLSAVLVSAREAAHA